MSVFYRKNMYGVDNICVENRWYELEVCAENKQTLSTIMDVFNKFCRVT